MSGPRLSIIPARAATDRSLKPRDLQVLCVLGRHTDDLGWCRRSQVKMADEMGCARSTVFDAIERLVKAGYLERFVQASDSGRDSAHVYRVVLDPVHPSVATVEEADTPCRQVGTPAGISAPPAGSEPAPPAGSEPAPINDPSLTTPQNEEEKSRGQLEDRKQVERWLKRVHPKWPTYVTDSEPKALSAAFGLTPEERQTAVERISDYLAHANVGGRTTICTFGVYLAERRWEKLPAPAAQPFNEHATPFSKPWCAWILAHLLTAEGEAEKGWPLVSTLYQKARLRQGHRFAKRWHDIGSAFEPVQVGSREFETWRLEFERRGWLWVPDPGKQPVVFFPAGGPGGLSEFEAAIRANEAEGNDDGARQAAE
ncbi:helix-turn-helix domain-containing protein [Nitratireductor indicus]|uniref:helix-turn-helix domain-containing protein n=1 Tax=Nitratireductor indicus TaxID=721133 RepID=UPI0003097848|nr:helix-turn-helix domain-containing protein [Nitratireductor indicus]SFQ12578.1 hypothetical protein SAMN05216176_101463 [Nitratireductor indicus]